MKSEAPATVIRAIPITADEQPAAKQHKIPLAAKMAVIRSGGGGRVTPHSARLLLDYYYCMNNKQLFIHKLKGTLC
jgi:hypothetical protein